MHQPEGRAPLVIGRYALHGALAAGGMATVHFGRLLGPAGFSRTVAIKRLHPQFAKDPEFVAMFLDEARLAARIQHPNVVATVDVVAQEDELFLVMDYVRGESFSRLLKASRKRQIEVPARIIASVMSGLLFGLHAAHEAKDEKGQPLSIVHRDVSPQNVLIGVDGIARVLDFGVAKAAARVQVTRHGQMKGKLTYMAPEQLRAQGADRRTDVFAAGIVLWEALTGRRLYDGDDAKRVLEKIVGDPVPPPSSLAPGTSRAFDDVVKKALEKEPADRYSSARDFAVAIEEAVPLASPREVGEWVERVAGETLSRREQKVAEIENTMQFTDVSDVTDVGREIMKTLDGRIPAAETTSSAPVIEPAPSSIEWDDAPTSVFEVSRNETDDATRVQVLRAALPGLPAPPSSPLSKPPPKPSVVSAPHRRPPPVDVTSTEPAPQSSRPVAKVPSVVPTSPHNSRPPPLPSRPPKSSKASRQRKSQPPASDAPKSSSRGGAASARLPPVPIAPKIVPALAIPVIERSGTANPPDGSDDAYDDSTTVYAPPAQIRGTGSAETEHPPTVIVKDDSRPNIRALPTTPAGLKIPDAVLKRVSAPVPAGPDSSAAVERPAETTQPRKAASTPPPPLAEVAKPLPPRAQEKVASKPRVPVYVAAVALAAASFGLTFVLSRSAPLRDAPIEAVREPEPPRPLAKPPEPALPAPPEVVEPASLPLAPEEPLVEKPAQAEPIAEPLAEPLAEPVDEKPVAAPAKRPKARRPRAVKTSALPAVAVSPTGPATATATAATTSAPLQPEPSPSKAVRPPPLDDILDNPYASMKAAAPAATSTPASPERK